MAARKVMRLKFKHQQFQTDAVEAVCDLFEGQPRQAARYLMDTGDAAQVKLAMEGFKNNPLKIGESRLLENLLKVQQTRKNNLRNFRNKHLEKLESNPVYSDGRKAKVKAPVFSIEMETGTGKTYTYIKTIYELNARYDWRKFIIVVPSVAIREGVAKTFAVTAEHFKQDYGKACRFFIYNSDKLSDIDTFASDAGIQVMIVNAQAFNATGAAARRIDMPMESFRNRRPIDVIAATNPIVIVDEPQSVLGDAKKAKTNATRNSLGKFNPLFFLNYSATHRENFNMVYRLDAVDAYNKQLVKQISVKGVELVNSTAVSGYVYLQEINKFRDKSPTATLIFEKMQSSGVKRVARNFAHGDDLYDYSGEIEAYQHGFKITAINALDGTVEFSGGMKLSLGEVMGDVSEDDVRILQIRETIISHLEKEFSLFKRGVKTLSLFFIDEVAKYREYGENGAAENGVYAKYFEKIYQEEVEKFFARLPLEDEKEYREYLRRDSAAKVHEGYFSKDKKGKLINSKAKREGGSDDVSAYDLIMKDKERLLSFDEPVRFIFSHSALREGWDNPNVFQICTLSSGASEIKKRQEIGRGLRLSVNQLGERMDAENLGEDLVHNVNSLTVIANESYENFAKALQSEYAEILSSHGSQLDASFFDGTMLENGENQHIFTSDEAATLKRMLEKFGVAKDGEIQPEFENKSSDEKKATLREALEFAGDGLGEFTESLAGVLDDFVNGTKIPVPKNSRMQKTLRLNQERYQSAKFRDLWNSIKRRTFYSVDFDEEDLIARSVQAINADLRVRATKVVVTEALLEKIDEKFNPRMRKLKGTESTLEYVVGNSTKYDLLAEICEKTELVRRTVARILSEIESGQFAKFYQNPEDFIERVAGIINSQKIRSLVE